MAAILSQPQCINAFEGVFSDQTVFKKTDEISGDYRIAASRELTHFGLRTYLFASLSLVIIG